MTVAVAVLAGCSDRSRLSPPDVLVDSAKLVRSTGCDAERVANAVGQRPTPVLLEAARSGAGASEVRTLAHDEPASFRFRAEQL
ncbi:MAG: hypothetical protein M3414_09410, partial [Pseudomonadota bacterium]|nr:hypothetical protein [Pseudomonadota bacterium]